MNHGAFVRLWPGGWPRVTQVKRRVNGNASYCGLMSVSIQCPKSKCACAVRLFVKIMSLDAVLAEFGIAESYLLFA